MKTKNSFVIIVILIIYGLLSSGTIVSQGIPQYLKKNPILKNTEITIQKPSDSRDLDFRHFNLLNKKSLPGTPHSDSIISYSTQTTSMKDYSTYDSQGNTVAYRRQYLTPDGWLNSFMITNTFNGTGGPLTSLLQEWQNNTWVDSSRITNTYDGSGNRLTNLLENRVNGNWVNVSLSTFTYDGSGNNLTEMDQQWDNTAWVNTNLYTYIYNGNNNKMSSQTQLWDGTNWSNSLFELWTYDGGNQIVTYLTAQWDGANWLNASLETYTYDSNENTLTYLSQYSPDGISWSNSSLMTYTYDDNGNQLTELDQMWQDPYWTNSAFTAQTFDTNGNRLTYTYQVWTGADWLNYSHGSETYDENSNCLTFINQLWNANGWKNYEKSEYTYQQNTINANAYSWNGGNWILGDGPLQVVLYNNSNPVTFFSEYFFTYNVVVYYSYYPTGIKDVTALPSSLHIFPNPATDYLTLKVHLNHAENVAIRLIDFSGRSVTDILNGIIQPGGKTFTISTKNIPAGQYIMEMRSESTVEKQKVIITQ